MATCRGYTMRASDSVVFSCCASCSCHRRLSSGCGCEYQISTGFRSISPQSQNARDKPYGHHHFTTEQAADERYQEKPEGYVCCCSFYIILLLERSLIHLCLGVYTCILTDRNFAVSPSPWTSYHTTFSASQALLLREP